MSPAAQIKRNSKNTKTEHTKNSPKEALYSELSKGMESLKKGDVYTVDEAWEVLDKI